MRLRCNHGVLHSLGLDCAHYYDENLINAKIREVDKRFDLIMVKEFWQESILLLKNLIGMNWMDILQTNRNLTKGKEILSTSILDKLKHLIWPDYVFYEHFLRKFREIISENEDNLKKEGAIYDLYMKNIKQECDFEKINVTKGGR